MPSEETMMSKFYQYWKSYEVTNTIYADLESLIKKQVEDVKINPEKSSTAKVIEHIPGSYSISMKLLFKWKKIIEMKKNRIYNE